jgi:hypothetical protein
MNESTRIGGVGKTYTKRECSCYEAAPGRFVVQLSAWDHLGRCEVSFYDVTPLPAPAWGKAAFRFCKAEAMAERATYNVLLDGDRSTCDCPHSTYRPEGGACRHILAAAALVSRGKLPTPKPARVSVPARLDGKPVAVPTTVDAPAAQPAGDDYCTCDDCGRPAAECSCELVLAPAAKPAEVKPAAKPAAKRGRKPAAPKSAPAAAGAPAVRWDNL